MPYLTIDQREIDVPDGSTILDAAERLGIEIPTLCFARQCEPSTSCLVCLVKLLPSGRMAPACATPVTEGMQVESETGEMHAVRRSTLELLLSDHLGDCVAPCSFGCPAQMNIPQMLRQIMAGELREALITVKADIAMPAVLGRICPAPCEKVCRRGNLDGSIAICELKRVVADVDLASAEPYLPRCRPASGKQVAIVGGGPAGLAAAYYLAQGGHACTIFDDTDTLGGMFGREIPAEKLPRDVLEREIAQILRLGIATRLNSRVGRDVSLAELRAQYNVVVLAVGWTAAEQVPTWGIGVSGGGIAVKRRTYETNQPGVFAVGNALRGQGTTGIRSVADAKEAAVAIDQFLSARAVVGTSPPFTTRIGKMAQDELVQLSTDTAKVPRCDSASRVEVSAAEEQAARCLHCDCRALTTCRLRRYSALYGADPRRFKAERRKYDQDIRHADILFEPGKCIDCGLCVQITAAGGEDLGLTYIGRGFDVRVGVPLGHSSAEALLKVAAECVAACPTAAIAWKRNTPKCASFAISGDHER
ncbi:MAG: 2Fe-2S iron-sulfur cluster-binding protein [Thermoguttaceae bacterium]